MTYDIDPARTKVKIGWQRSVRVQKKAFFELVELFALLSSSGMLCLQCLNCHGCLARQT